MWNELFITYNGTSLFCELLTNYTRSQERQLIRMLKIKESTCSTINLGNLPFIITTLGDKITSITEIAKFICNLTGTQEVLFGRSSTDVDRHVTFINDFDTAPNKLEFLNKVLMYNSFCNGFHITISDIYAFANILVSIQHIHDKEKYEYSNIFRWALHIHNMKGIIEQVTRLKMNIYAPTEKLFIELKKEGIDANVKKEKINKKENQENKENNEAKAKEAKEAKENKAKEPKEVKENKDKKDEKAEKTDKPEKSENKQQPKGGKKKEEDDTHPISKLEIRVGRIVSIEENKDSDKLYNELVDMGNGQIRKIASGLKGKIPLEKLKDQLVVVLCNLKERTLCGWPSHGMLLCASKSEKEIDFLRPPSNANPGDLITIGDYPNKPDEFLNPKKSPWDAVKEKMKVRDDGSAAFDDVSVWKVQSGDITCSLIKGGQIS